jgi:hypothetical protein
MLSYNVQISIVSIRLCALPVQYRQTASVGCACTDFGSNWLLQIGMIFTVAVACITLDQMATLAFLHTPTIAVLHLFVVDDMHAFARYSDFCVALG